MSATFEKMSGEEARHVLMSEVFAPVFFQKLAANGIDPQSEDERLSYLRIGQKLLAADQQENVKKASSRVGFLSQAESDLDAEMSRRYGYESQQQTDLAQETYVKEASDLLGDHPLIQQAVEDYNAAIAAEEAR